jgi:hypothetical protein
MLARLCAGVALVTVAACGAPDAATPPSPASSPAAAPQRFADVTAPDFTSAVKVRTFDPAAKSTVVEPIIFMEGARYCASFGVSAVDGRCSQPVVIEDSHTKVALPLAAKVSLRLDRGGDDRCLGTMTTGATCAATAAAFAAAVREQGEMPARVTVRGGEVVALAQLYVS